MKLRCTLPALADLNSVLDHIAIHSAQGARRVQARIQAIIELLLLYPGIGARTDDPTIRRMTALPCPYLIFYEATETEIIIHAVAMQRVILPECRALRMGTKSARRTMPLDRAATDLRAPRRGFLSHLRQASLCGMVEAPWRKNRKSSQC